MATSAALSSNLIKLFMDTLKVSEVPTYFLYNYTEL